MNQLLFRTFSEHPVLCCLISPKRVQSIRSVRAQYLSYSSILCVCHADTETLKGKASPPETEWLNHSKISLKNLHTSRQTENTHTVVEIIIHDACFPF